MPPWLLALTCALVVFFALPLWIAVDRIVFAVRTRRRIAVHGELTGSPSPYRMFWTFPPPYLAVSPGPFPPLSWWPRCTVCGRAAQELKPVGRAKMCGVCFAKLAPVFPETTEAAKEGAAMAEAYHEYEFPLDKTVHWHGLGKELRGGAATTAAEQSVTCPGCKAWLEARRASAAWRTRS